MLTLRTVREWQSGAEGSRTLDLLNAIQALSQLSYGPTGGRNTSGDAHIARCSQRVNQISDGRLAALRPQLATTVVLPLRWWDSAPA